MTETPPEPTLKTWEIAGTGLTQQTITGTHVEVTPENGRTTFYNGDEVVASFVQLFAFVLLDDAPSE